MEDFTTPPHWAEEHQALCPHFHRICQQPARVQPLLLSKLSCGLRLPPEQVVVLYEEFVSHVNLEKSPDP
jgi:hypothetical protein